MEKLISLISFVVLFLAACEPEYIPTPPTMLVPSTQVAVGTNIPLPTDIPQPTSIPLASRGPLGVNPAQQAAITSLSSTLNLSADQIKSDLRPSRDLAQWLYGCATHGSDVY